MLNTLSLDMGLLMSTIELKKEISKISIDEKVCVDHLLGTWKHSAPLAHKKILLNCHLTTATLLLVQLFVESGADFKITCTKDLVSHQSIKTILIDLGLYISPEELEFFESLYHAYDVVLDCGAHLADFIHPKIGFIELTHVEQWRYTNTTCPVVSVDGSFIKQIETSLGTGDGFLRAIETIYQNTEWYKNKNYMIFGFGKVGRGICTCLLRAGVDRNQITVVEIDELCRISANKMHVKSYSLNHNKEEIRHLLLSNTINCVVTATGVEDAISRFFDLEDFATVELLCNMGTDDEWGDKFPDDSVYYQKKPINFMLDYPTKIKYLDPIFALMAISTLDMIKLQPTKKFCIMKPSALSQEEILSVWIKNRPFYEMIVSDFRNDNLLLHAD